MRFAPIGDWFRNQNLRAGWLRSKLSADTEHLFLSAIERPGPPCRSAAHGVTTDSLVRVHSLIDEWRRLGRIRELRDYIRWSGQDSADYADGEFSEALADLRAGELDEELAPSAQNLRWARQELAREGQQED